jgi:lysophospholipase L1-like esterase
MTDEIQALLHDGDVVAMIGDSITSDGCWWVSVREQLLARHPGVRCDFRNCGISGGGAGGALRRYAWDIAPHQPTVALVMFGMNDVWRDAYVPAPTEDMLTGRADCLQRFLINMHALVERLLADGVRVILLTPTPYDQYSPAQPAPNLPGVDDALAICGGMVKGLGIAKDLPVIDLHTPLRRRCAALEPLIRDDRVHPNDLGHAAMGEIVTAALLPGAAVPVPPALYAASRAVHEAERRQRTLAMFRAWVEERDGGRDDAAILRYIARTQATEPNPWVREQMTVCRELLPQQAELAAEVAVLRQRLTEVTVAL